MNADPEHGKAVKTQTDTGVVHDTDIGVTRIGGELALFVGASGFEDDSTDDQDRFDLYVFCTTDA